jgi:hypothetical protein
MGGRSCSICSHERASEITKGLTRGDSVRGIASRFGVTPAAAARHLNNCLRITRRAEKSGQTGARTGTSDAPRFDSSGRCQTCGQLGPDADTSTLDPKSIVRRAEALVARSERVADRAEQDDNLALVLASVDRCQRGIDTLAKIAGLLKPEGQVNVHVDASQRGLALIGQIPTDILERMAAGDQGTLDAFAALAIGATLPALPAGGSS